MMRCPLIRIMIARPALHAPPMQNMTASRPAATGKERPRNVCCDSIRIGPVRHLEETSYLQIRLRRNLSVYRLLTGRASIPSWKPAAVIHDGEETFVAKCSASWLRPEA
jgi:hypothetical protein